MRDAAKDIMLDRIRKSIANVPEHSPIPRDFRARDERDRTAILEDFIDRLFDYKAMVTCTNDADLPQAIADACQQQAITHIVVPADVPASWIPVNVTLLKDEPPLTFAELDETSAVLTGCALAIAQTGTIILDGGATQGRRAPGADP